MTITRVLGLTGFFILACYHSCLMANPPVADGQQEAYPFCVGNPAGILLPLNTTILLERIDQINQHNPFDKQRVESILTAGNFLSTNKESVMHITEQGANIDVHIFYRGSQPTLSLTFGNPTEANLMAASTILALPFPNCDQINAIKTRFFSDTDTAFELLGKYPERVEKEGMYVYQYHQPYHDHLMSLGFSGMIDPDSNKYLSPAMLFISFLQKAAPK